MTRAVGSKNAENIDKNLNQLTSEFAATPYATQAQLLAAKEAVQKNDLDKAVMALESAVKLSGDRELSTLANFRLAKVKFAQAYQGVVEELRGDVLAAQGKKDEARTAYEAARTAMEETRVGDVNLLQMKLSDLGT